jgi:hypothetical protein
MLENKNRVSTRARILLVMLRWSTLITVLGFWRSFSPEEERRFRADRVRIRAVGAIQLLVLILKDVDLVVILVAILGVLVVTLVAMLDVIRSVSCNNRCNISCNIIYSQGIKTECKHLHGHPQYRDGFSRSSRTRVYLEHVGALQAEFAAFAFFAQVRRQIDRALPQFKPPCSIRPSANIYEYVRIRTFTII